MSIIAKHCLVWTMLMAMSVQGMAAVLSAVRGPAHFHATASGMQAAEAAHDHAPSYFHHAHAGTHYRADESARRRVGHFEAALALAAGYAQAAYSPYRAHHSAHHHHQAQRHHHLPGSDAVVVHDGSHTDTGATAERTSRGESVSPAFVAVTSEALVFKPIDAGAGFAISYAKKLESCSLSRIERPPRLPSA